MHSLLLQESGCLIFNIEPYRFRKVKGLFFSGSALTVAYPASLQALHYNNSETNDANRT